MRAQPLQIAVIGGGLVGLGTALRLQQMHPRAQVTVFEKEAQVGMHQSGRNSGVLHAGLYYKPGSVKARLAVRGIRQMISFCQANQIAHEVCGKLVVATAAEEEPRLMDLYARGQANGLSGLEIYGPEQIRDREPHAAGRRALLVPEEGIVDYGEVARTMARQIASGQLRVGRVAERPSSSSAAAASTEEAEEVLVQPGTVRTNTRVFGLERRQAQWLLQTTQGEFAADFIVNCGGLHCDRISQLAGEARQARIIPFRGEYYLLRSERQFLVKHLIYPVPDPAFPFLGVHFTRMVKGGVEAGPNAVLAFAREGYRKRDFRAADLWDALTFSGLWSFMRRYPGMASYELRRSLSRRLFCASLQRLVPEVQEADLTPGSAGIRAQAMLPNGDLVQDFLILDRPGALHVLNAPSPGATASLAIGEEIAHRCAPHLADTAA